MTTPSKSQQNDPDESHSDLTAFGGGVTIDPPSVTKRFPIKGEVNGRATHFGQLVDDHERGGTSFVTERDYDDHRIKKLGDEQGAYAISVSGLAQFPDDINRVYIREHENPDHDSTVVLEYHASQFLDGKNVPSAILGHDNSDGQRYVERNDDAYLHLWSGDDANLYRPRGETVGDGGDGE